MTDGARTPAAPAPPCLLCRVSRDQRMARVIAANDSAVAVLNTIEPFAAGHVVCFPRRHAARLDQLEDGELTAVLSLLKQVAHAMELQDYNVLQNNGAAAGQTIAHAHFHLIPKRAGDGLCYERPNPRPFDPDDVHLRITRALQRRAGAEPLGAEQHKRVVREFIDALNAQAWSRLETLVADEVVRHGRSGDRPPVRSRAELIAFLQREAETFPDAREEVQFLVGEGDMVAARLGFSGTQRGAMGPFTASGRRLTADFIAIFRLAGGRIAEVWVEWDNLAALVQLGHLRLPD